MRHLQTKFQETTRSKSNLDLVRSGGEAGGEQGGELSGEFSGYASLFGQVDLGRDRVEKGAFLQTLRSRPATSIRMLYQHDPAHPIGVWQEIREDSHGLFVKGRIIDQTTKGREVLSLMQAGALDGLSIGFHTRKSRIDRKSGIRSILEADLWEISIVTFPMLPRARVEHTTKSCSSDPPSALAMPGLERKLRCYARKLQQSRRYI